MAVLPCWLVNSQPGGAIAAQAALLEAFAQYLGLDFGAESMTTPVATAPPAAPAPVDLNQYAGRYEIPAASYELHVVDNGLVLSAEVHRLLHQVQPILRTEAPRRIPVEMIAEDLALVTIAGAP